MKRLVRNRAHPEGSIAEGYVTNECHMFASRYMRNRVTADQTPTKDKKLVKYPRSDLEQVHAYVLNNLQIFSDYRRRHLEKLKNEISGRNAAHDIQKKHIKDFPDWFRNDVDKDILAGTLISEEILVHAQRPYYEVRRYSEHIINGYKFKTVAIDDKLVTQNSGVMGCFAQDCFSSTRDQNPVEADILYYGQLEDIVEIIYGYGKLNQRSYIMFKVRWSPAKPRKDHYGFTLVNLDKEIYLDEKFIFAEQADQCFYVKDPKVATDWVVLYKEPRSVVLPNNNENIDEDINEPIGSSDDIWQDFSYPQNVMLDMTDSETQADIPIVITDRDSGSNVQIKSTTSRRKQTMLNIARTIETRSRAKHKEQVVEGI